MKDCLRKENTNFYIRLRACYEGKLLFIVRDRGVRQRDGKWGEKTKEQINNKHTINETIY